MLLFVYMYVTVFRRFCVLHGYVKLFVLGRNCQRIQVTIVVTDILLHCFFGGSASFHNSHCFMQTYCCDFVFFFIPLQYSLLRNVYLLL